MSTTVIQAYRFVLDPTPRQVRDLERHAGAARFAYNWALARVKANLGQRSAEAIYNIAADELTPTLGWNLPALRRAWNATKRDAAPWWTECSKEAFNTGCSFTCEIQRTQRTPTRPDLVVGVDLGITHLAVLSRPVPGVSDADGFVPGPRHLRRAQRDLRHASRRVSRRCGPDRRNGQRPSKRWEKANRQRNTVHHRVTNLRRDGLHKLTTGLAAAIGVLVVEDLNVAGMLKNRRLARHLADASFGEIRRQLQYKTCWNGGHLVVADRWFPSSKTCSRCWAVKPKLSLSTRVFRCEHCGLVIDRDLNAAINLKHQVAQSGWETINGRGADRKTKPGLAGGCEASTPHRLAGQDGDRSPVTASWDE